MINITSDTDDFYPLVTLSKSSLSSTPSDFRTLNYSNFINYTQKFGDLGPYLLNQKDVRFSYF